MLFLVPKATRDVPEHRVAPWMISGVFLHAWREIEQQGYMVSSTPRHHRAIEIHHTHVFDVNNVHAAQEPDESRPRRGRPQHLVSGASPHTHLPSANPAAADAAAAAIGSTTFPTILKSCCKTEVTGPEGVSEAMRCRRITSGVGSDWGVANWIDINIAANAPTTIGCCAFGCCGVCVQFAALRTAAHTWEGAL